MSLRGNCVFGIESNTTSPVPPVAEAARLGLIPVTVLKDVAFYPPGYFDGCAVLHADTDDPAAVEAAISAHPGMPAAVFSSTDRCIETAAIVAEALGQRTAGAAVIRRARDKATQEAHLRAAGVLTPRTAVISARTADMLGVISALTYPVVVKPTKGTGSTGVTKCRDVAAAHGAVCEQLAVTACDTVLVQEYIVGPEMSVEMLNGRAVAVMAKHLAREPSFVETGHDLCCDMDPAAAVRACAEAATAALGLIVGAAHVELRDAAQGPTIIEVNPRMAGGRIPAVIRHGLGIDLALEQVRDLVGGCPRLDPTRRIEASIRFALADEAGVLESVSGAGSARAVPGVVEVTTAAPGRRVVLGDFRQRVGSVIAMADPTARLGAVAVADRAVALLRPEVGRR